MDQTDLYDYEIKQIAVIWKELQMQWGRKQNSQANLQEFAKVAHHAFLEAGFVVNVQWENSLIMVPDVSAIGGVRSAPITIEVIGRVPGSGGFKEEGQVLFDHELKRHEVLRAKERGEKFHGEKGTVST